MADHGRKGASIIKSTVGREMKRNPPKIIAKTRRKKGKAVAARQRTAIFLSKVRAVGANV